MPRGTILTEAERQFLLGACTADDGSQRSLRHIQKLLKEQAGRTRSINVIRNFLANPERYGMGKAAAGRKRRVSSRTRRQIVQQALKNPHRGVRGVASIVSEAGTRVSKSLVHRVLTSNSNVAFVKAKSRPHLKPHHRQQRCTWAETVVKDSVNFRDVLWTDEKRFNLDGPDHFAYFWHDLRNEVPKRMARRFGGGGIMFWGGFCARTPGIRCLVKVDGNLNAIKYQQLLTEHLLPKLPRSHRMRRTLLFQQDNASPHSAHSTKEFLQRHFTHVMDWPALSPDLNPIENIWGLMARRVYAGNRQFSTLDELETAVFDCWSSISQQEFERLADSVQDRVLEVLKKNGSATRF